jgi:hypothetical protein
LKTETARSSEMSVNFKRTTWRHNPENSTLHSHRYANLKSSPP